MNVQHDPEARSAAPRRQYCPHHDPDGYDARRLIGKRLLVARQAARAHDCSVRVVKRDGDSLVITLDFSATRIDVAVTTAA